MMTEYFYTAIQVSCVWLFRLHMGDSKEGWPVSS